MKSFLVIGILLLCSSTLGAESAEHPLWPDGLPPGAQSISAERIAELRAKNTAERIAYVARPTITVHQAAQPNGCGVVIFPGGGYNILAYEKEGTEIAQWFNSIGVTAGVVKYRVPRREPSPRHLEPVQDGQRAIRWLRKHADQFRVDPKRIGVLGFSAGGHLACMVGMHWNKPWYEARDQIDKQSARPDFMCPIYAAYLGNDFDDGRAELGSLVRINKQTPPTFLSVTADDKMRGAQAALLFVELLKAEVPAEVHVFAKGGHGYGIRGDKPASQWHKALAGWLDGQGLLMTKGKD